jgi:integrase/recombinase XerD
LLSAYLGHAHVTDTQWYLTATPQLLRHVLRRVERSERRGRP